MKGISNAALVVILLIGAISVVGIGVAWYSSYAASLLAMQQASAVTYDGEFSDGYLATEGNFHNDFAENTDCNITNDILGGGTNQSCIYYPTSWWNISAGSNRNWYLAWAFDLNGDVKKVNVEVDLSNLNTLQAVDDADIVSAGVYTHDDNPQLVYDLTPAIEEGSKIDADTGVLADGEYVLYLEFQTGLVNPSAVSGDRIANIELKADTTGDVDKAFVTLDARAITDH